MSATSTTELPTREVTLAWSDALVLELDFMDNTHREFVDLLAATELADDDTVLDRFSDLIDHTDDHFGREDKWMAEIGHKFKHLPQMFERLGGVHP